MKQSSANISLHSVQIYNIKTLKSKLYLNLLIKLNYVETIEQLSVADPRGGAPGARPPLFSEGERIFY